MSLAGKQSGRITVYQEVHRKKFTVLGSEQEGNTVTGNQSGRKKHDRERSKKDQELIRKVWKRPGRNAKRPRSDQESTRKDQELMRKVWEAIRKG